MILAAAGLLWLALTSIHALNLGDTAERILSTLAALAALAGAGYFGKVAIAMLEKRSRAR